MSESRDSSPLSSPPNSQLPPPVRPPRRKLYHPARALPFELKTQITIYFEEALYTQAFSLLQSLVSSSAHADITQPTFVPSATHLALASTLTVHPALTTRTTSTEKWKQADSALRLLRIVTQVVGPAHSNFRRAFTFLRFRWGSTRKSSGNVLRKIDRTEDGAGVDDGKIENQYAQGESLYSHAEDFWHVVGWAFNCSRLYPKRWERWVLWLEWMIGVLEDDWRGREEGEGGEGQFENSLIYFYISHASGGSGRNRRMLRSVFANGTTKALNEFGEVFRNESKAPKSEDSQRIKKRQVDVDVEADIYGDYMTKDDDDDDDDDDDEPSEHETNIANRFFKRTRTRDASLRRLTPKASTSSLNSAYSEHRHDDDDDDNENGPLVLDSLHLRLGLLSLLSSVSVALPSHFCNGSDLYSLLVEFIRPLPLPTFQSLISPLLVPRSFSLDAQCTLCEFLLTRSLLEAAAPATTEPWLRQSKMESCYLPYAATSASVVDNAKVSLCVETLLRNLAGAGKLRGGVGLEEAVMRGIQRRCQKAGGGRGEGGGNKGSRAARRREGQEEEVVAWKWLLESGERLRDVVERVRC